MLYKIGTLVEEQKSFLNAVKWAYVLNWGERIGSAGVFFVLAGMLGPKDFGTVMLATIYIGFLQMFLHQGLPTALIQRKFLEQAHLDSAFWANLALSIVLVAISLVFSRYWADFTHEPEVASVIYVLSFSIVLEALSIVQTAFLGRQMNFRALSIRTNTSIFFGGIVGVVMAFYGFGVWSLVGQQLLRDLLALVLLWRISSWRPTLSFSWLSFYELLRFGIPTFIGQLADFADTVVASTVLGALFGPFAVGLYKLVERTVVTVIALASGSFFVVSFPQFSRFQDNPSELRKSVLTALGMTATTSLPALVGLAVVSGRLMATIGPQWVPASDALKVLCVVGVGAIFANFTNPLLQALGRPRQGAVLEWGRTIIGIAAVALAGFMVQNSSAHYQVLSIAVARLCTGWFLIFPVSIYILLKRSHVSLRDFVIAAFPSLLASGAVVLSVELLGHFAMLEGSKPVIALVAQTVVGVLVGVTTLIIADQRGRRSLGLISEKLAKQFST